MKGTTIYALPVMSLMSVSAVVIAEIDVTHPNQQAKE
jgi:hypothetical protein